MRLTAIAKVLAQYKTTETGVITKEMISDAWAELLEAEHRLIRIDAGVSEFPVEGERPVEGEKLVEIPKRKWWQIF